RLGHQRPPQLDQASPTEAQRLDRHIGDVEQPQQVEGLVGAALLLGARIGQVQDVLPQPPGAETGPLGDQQVITPRHPREELPTLEGAPEAKPGALVHGQARDVTPVEDDPPPIGAQDSEQAIEEGRLPGAVRADQPDGLAGLHADGHVVERGDAREALTDFGGLEQAHDLCPGLPAPTVAGSGRVLMTSPPVPSRGAFPRVSQRCTVSSDLRLLYSRMPSGCFAYVTAPSPNRMN